MPITVNDKTTLDIDAIDPYNTPSSYKYQYIGGGSSGFFVATDPPVEFEYGYRITGLSETFLIFYVEAIKNNFLTQAYFSIGSDFKPKVAVFGEGGGGFPRGEGMVY